MQQIELENDYREAYYRTKCFKGIFTHDISNLFQIISNSIELCGALLKDEMNVREIISYFELITQQVNRGKKLINNMRSLSKLEEFEMPIEPVELEIMLRNAVQFVHMIFPNKKITISFNPNHGNHHVMANELLLDVFENLLMNSVVYNNNEEIIINIIVSLVKHNGKDYVKCEFIDNGIGIEDAQKHIIFQGAQFQNKRSKGLGIGLSLVANLIDLYGGVINIENRVKGDFSQGSNFILLIPEMKITWSEN